MDLIIKINAQTNGREKLLRLAYFSCILSKNVIQKNNSNLNSLKKIESLEELLDICRKVIFFGRAIDVFNSTLNSLIIKDTILQITISLSRISSSIYLLIDHIVLLKRLNFLYKKNEKLYVNISQRFLMMSITMNLFRDVYEIQNFINSYKSKKKNVLHKHYNKPINEDVLISLSEYIKLFKVNRHITADTIKNLFDFLICYSSLQKKDDKFSSNFVSLLGITSSLLGILPLVKYSYRLSP